MNLLILLGCILHLSWVSNVVANNAGPYLSDDDENARPSGSGMDTTNEVEIREDAVDYKQIELKFATKQQFQNSPSSTSFMAEVVEALIYALNADGGPTPGKEHRPAMISLTDVTRVLNKAEGGTKRQRRGASGGETHVFKVWVSVPQNTNEAKFINRLERNPFFENIKVTRRRELKTPIDESELTEFENSRLPPTTNIDGTHPGFMDNNNINKGGKDSHSVHVKPDPNDPYNPNNKIEFEVEYGTFPSDFLHDPVTLAALIAGALACLLCTILCTIFVVYRMRKKDEGSYALDEPKTTYKFKHEMYIQNQTKEFFA